MVERPGAEPATVKLDGVTLLYPENHNGLLLAGDNLTVILNLNTSCVTLAGQNNSLYVQYNDGVLCLNGQNNIVVVEEEGEAGQVLNAGVGNQLLRGGLGQVWTEDPVEGWFQEKEQQWIQHAQGNIELEAKNQAESRLKLQPGKKPIHTQDCGICLEKFASQAQKLHIKCGHGFHHACITSWIQKMPLCPICRSAVQL